MNQKTDLEHIMILLDSAAPTFCYYETEKRSERIMPFEVLKGGIDLAAERSLGITAIYGRTPLPDEHCELLEPIPHIRILPYDEKMYYNDEDLVVMDISHHPSFPYGILDREITHLIVNIPINRFNEMYVFIENNYRFFKRLSVIYKGLEQANESTLNAFRLSLQKLRPLLHNLLLREQLTEMGFVTDRMILNKMNNCNAGLSHITLAPDGNFYICPGFYYDRQSTAGSIKTDIHIPNRQLYEYSHAPVCEKCDCYQCKRCVYLNRRTTLEVNTPSHAQCVVSHHERNLSGFLLDKLQSRGRMLNLPAIKPLYYLDPMEIIQ